MADPKARIRKFLVVVDKTPECRVAIRFATRRAQHTGGRVTSPMPGTVLRVRVTQGQLVFAGDALVVVSAMKMVVPREPIISVRPNAISPGAPGAPERGGHRPRV